MNLSQFKPRPLSKESAILLEAIDTNCNTCMFFHRDLEWATKHRKKGTALSHSFGRCAKKQMNVKPPNGLCTPENGITGDDCWESRRSEQSKQP